jgi:hypothetical protein
VSSTTATTAASRAAYPSFYADTEEGSEEPYEQTESVAASVAASASASEAAAFVIRQMRASQEAAVADIDIDELSANQDSEPVELSAQGVTASGNYRFTFHEDDDSDDNDDDEDDEEENDYRANVAGKGTRRVAGRNYDDMAGEEGDGALSSEYYTETQTMSAYSGDEGRGNREDNDDDAHSVTSSSVRSDIDWFDHRSSSDTPMSAVNAR